MAYQPLDINPSTPAKVKDFIRHHLDMQFNDIHCMLRLPIPEQELTAGCNFAAATFLLDLISGISTVLYKQSGGSGARYKELLRHYYPWDREPTAGAVTNPTTGAADLYKLFRNPLAHALGMGITEIKKVIHRKPFQITIGIAKDGLSEDLVRKT